MIYLVEDDDNIRQLVVYTLNSTGLPAEGFALPSQFWQAMERQLPDVVLLDIMLPEESGLDILSRLRTEPRMRKLPVVMLTAMGSEYDKVKGFDMGADDYIPKPFGMMELVARIRALLRRTAPEEPAAREYRAGELTLSLEKHEVCVSGQPVTLTLKEFEVLALLLEHRGRVLSRDRILQQVWGYSYAGESRTVDVHMGTLRQKLGPAGSRIETVRGVGYKIAED